MPDAAPPEATLDQARAMWAADAASAAARPAIGLARPRQPAATTPSDTSR